MYLKIINTLHQNDSSAEIDHQSNQLIEVPGIPYYIVQYGKVRNPIEPRNIVWLISNPSDLELTVLGVFHKNRLTPRLQYLPSSSQSVPEKSQPTCMHREDLR